VLHVRTLNHVLEQFKSVKQIIGFSLVKARMATYVTEPLDS
jgi:hypothetical protein